MTLFQQLSIVGRGCAVWERGSFFLPIQKKNRIFAYSNYCIADYGERKNTVY